MDYFEFKQFRIYHDRCAMKVGTDGVLLGAWAEVKDARRVLDIGCGSGLIAIMAAQRCEATIVGVEIDEQSACQADQNAGLSPWRERIHVVSNDITTWQPAELFDCILTNPPFFVETTLSPTARRAQARHTAGLDFEQLVIAAKRLMTPGASFQLIVPSNSATHLKALCALYGLSLVRQTDVCTKPGAAPKRSLLHFINDITPSLPVTDALTLLDEKGNRSDDYHALTTNYYLDMQTRR